MGGGKKERKKKKALINYKHVITKLPQPINILHFSSLHRGQLGAGGATSARGSHQVGRAPCPQAKGGLPSRLGGKEYRSGDDFSGCTDSSSKCHLGNRCAPLKLQRGFRKRLPDWLPELRVGHELSAAASSFFTLFYVLWSKTKLMVVQLVTFHLVLSRTTASYLPATTVFSSARCCLLIAYQQGG